MSMKFEKLVCAECGNEIEGKAHKFKLNLLMGDMNAEACEAILCEECYQAIKQSVKILKDVFEEVKENE